MKVQNIISLGPSDELYLTFTFDLERPDLEAGSDKAKEFGAEWGQTALKTVQHTIEVVREMVVKGDIK